MKVLSVLVTSLFISILTYGQVSIGSEEVNPCAVLELSSPDKGFLISRVALQGKSICNPLTANVAGMIVYNTATAGSGDELVTPGLYVNNGASWEKMVLKSEMSESKTIGREILSSVNGTFVKVGSEFIWTAGASGVPAFAPAASVAAPYGSSTSYITVIPGANGTTPDQFTCSKNIISLRFYTHMQISTVSNSRWRTNLFLNGVQAGTGQYWGSPANNVANVRVFGTLEYGAIPANTPITVKVDTNSLPLSVQNAASYFVIEYEM